MEFEWDESKRRRNIAKHGINFQEVTELFDGRPVHVLRSPYAHETRFETTGIFNGRFITVIWTTRANVTRIISARSARDGDRRKYRSLYHG